MWQATQNQKLLVLKLVQIARHDSTRTNTIVRFHGGRREPWSSGHGRRLAIPMVVGSNPSAIYWMVITFFQIYLL